MDESKYKKVEKIFVEYLEQKKLRKTPERFAILEEIYTRDRHFDAEALYISMKNKNYRVSRATVYNTLDLLLESELVSRHRFGKNLARYEIAYGYKQHDHIICTECLKVGEFCDPRLQQIKDMTEKLLKFKVMRHSLNLYGLCEDCLKTHEKTNKKKLIFK